MAIDQRALDTPLNEYIRTLRRRIWWLFSTALIVVVAAGLYSYSETKTYTSTAVVEVLNTASGKSGSQSLATDATLVNSSAVKSIVAGMLKQTPPPQASASASGTTSLISIAANNPVPATAAQIANDYASALITVLGQQQQKNINDELNVDNQEIAGLQKDETSLENALKVVVPTQPLTPTQQADQAQLKQDLSTVSSLQEQVSTLKAQLQKASDTATQTSIAQPPKSPSSPKTARNIGFGLIVGLIFGLILVFVVDAFDDSIRTENDIDRIYPELAHLGIVPIVEDWSDVSQPYVASLSSPRSIVAEAYRSLRTSIEFTRLSNQMRSIVVTSSIGLEGKTSTVANLGVTYARAGKKTLVVSADLRRPRLGSFFGLAENTGLTSIALGIATIDEAVQAVPDATGLHFLGTGPLPDGAAEFLSSPRLEAVLNELCEEFEIIIIDAPPVLPVTDAVVMSRYVDGVLLVVAQNRTSRRSLAKIRRTFQQGKIAVIGSILNGAVISKADNYGYYGYYSYSDGKPGTKDTSRSQKGGKGAPKGSEKVRAKA